MRSRAVAVIVVLGAMTSVQGVLPARAVQAGTLKLFAQKPEITVHHSPHRAVVLNAGVYAEALGGDFEIHETRADYLSPIEASQWAGGSLVQNLDPSMVDSWNGLANFLHVRVKAPNGDTIIDRDQTWCPGGYGIQRVDDSGPDVTRLPQFGCFANPFTLGLVYGVDQGWAAPVSSRYWTGTEPVIFSGRDGTYHVTYSFPQAVIDTFGIDPRDAEAKVTVNVETTRRVAARASTARTAPANESAAPRVPIDPNPDPSIRPDLQALPSSYMRVQNLKDGRSFLAFAATIWSSGPSPMVVEGYRRPGSDVMDAFEYFYDGDTAVSKAPVGTFEYDTRKGHHHWHMEQFARYSLLNADQSEAVLSEKQSFCLAPTDAIDLTQPNADWSPTWYGGSDGLSTACGGSDAIWIREVLPVGWGDTYYQWVGGQSFDITGLPNGRYYVKVAANPTGSMIETDPNNNPSLRRVILRGTRGHRRVIVPPYMGIDTDGCRFC
jgi:hypothetical protein